MIDISKDRNLIETVNASLNNGKIVELKNEGHGESDVVAVEITRSVRYHERSAGRVKRIDK